MKPGFKRKTIRRAFAFLLAVFCLLFLPFPAYAESVGPYEIGVYGQLVDAKTAHIEIWMEDPHGTGWKSVTVKTTNNGTEYDFTEPLTEYGRIAFAISGNTDIVTTITEPGGARHVDSRRAWLFEGSAPQTKAPVSQSSDGAANSESSTEAASAAPTQASEAEVPASSPGPAQDKKTSMVQVPEASTDTDTSTPPMNTEGTASVIDNATTGPNEREFFTIQTPLGNDFYLIVDRNKENNNVFFLNAVTEQDLLALAEGESWTEGYEGAGGVDNSIPDGAIPEPEKDNPPAGETPEESGPEESGDEPPPDKGGGGSPLIVAGVVLLPVLGAGYYFKIIKPKRALDNADDLEDIQYLDEDSEDYEFEDAEDDTD